MCREQLHTSQTLDTHLEQATSSMDMYLLLYLGTLKYSKHISKSHEYTLKYYQKIVFRVLLVLSRENGYTITLIAEFVWCNG